MYKSPSRDPRRQLIAGKKANDPRMLSASGTGKYRTSTERTELRKRGHERKWETRWNGFIMINGIESETELFARAEKVDLAEKDAHEALAHSNDAEIAYLRKPNNHTR